MERFIRLMAIGCALWVINSVPASAASYETEPCEAVEPGFSHSSGYIEEKSTVSLSAPEGYAVYYTVDGSEPTTESVRYTDEIVLSAQPSVLAANADKWSLIPDSYKTDSTLPSAEVIRAIAVAPDGTAGDIVTNTYFFSPLPSIPVISLVMEYDDLLDYETGIIAKGAVYDAWKTTESARPIMEADQKWLYEGNFSQKGKEWERPVHLQIFENGELTESDAGIRLHGGASRRVAQKGFNIYFREDYGEMRENLRFNKDQVIFHQGDAGDCMYYIGNGTVGIYTDYGTDKEVLLAELNENQFFGEMGLIEKLPRSATAVILENDTVLTRLTEEGLDRMFEERPTFVLLAMQHISSRLRRLTKEYGKACKMVAKMHDEENGRGELTMNDEDAIRYYVGLAQSRTHRWMYY